MDLNWLRDFECLARTQNFTRAADERCITQSAFSRRIKALESWVGMPLINRATYPVQLTEAGRQFLPTATAALSDLTTLRHTLRDADKGAHEFIRFSVLHTISVHYLADRIDQLQREMPQIRTRVISDSLSTCCDLLVEGAVDMMLCYAHNAVAPLIDETAFARKTLLEDRLIPVAATAPARTHGWSLDTANGRDIPYLAYEKSSFLGMVVDHTIGPRRLNATPIYIDALVEAIKRRLMAGSGFAWMPETSIARELADGQLIAIGGEDWRAKITICAYANPSGFGATTQQVWDSI